MVNPAFYQQLLQRQAMAAPPPIGGAPPPGIGGLPMGVPGVPGAPAVGAPMPVPPPGIEMPQLGGSNVVGTPPPPAVVPEEENQNVAAMQGLIPVIQGINENMPGAGQGIIPQAQNMASVRGAGPATGSSARQAANMAGDIDQMATKNPGLFKSLLGAFGLGG